MSMHEFVFGSYELDPSVNIESALEFYINRAKEINRGVGIEGVTGNETILTCEGVKGTFPKLTDEEAQEVANRFNDMINKAKSQEPKRIEAVGDVIVDKALKYYIDRALEMNRGNGREELTGNETELSWEAVKITFPNLTDEQAKEVAQRYNRMIKIVKETKGADKIAKECTGEEVEAAGKTLVDTPEIADNQSELEQ